MKAGLHPPILVGSELLVDPMLAMDQHEGLRQRLAVFIRDGEVHEHPAGFG